MVKNGTLEELLVACHSLENLTLCVTDQCYSMMTRCCRQNKQTLKVLYLQFHERYPKLNSDIIQHVVFSCSELKEVSIIAGIVQKDIISYLVNNLSPNVEKLHLEIRDITDEHVKALVKRCNKLNELILEKEFITNKSVTNIKEHLPNLKKLMFFKSYLMLEKKRT
jgi:hypothetical protein